MKRALAGIRACLLQREAFAHSEKIMKGMRAARNTDEFVAEKR
jgi:hypothetical protein